MYYRRALELQCYEDMINDKGWPLSPVNMSSPFLFYVNAIQNCIPWLSYDVLNYLIMAKLIWVERKMQGPRLLLISSSLMLSPVNSMVCIRHPRIPGKKVSMRIS